MAHCSERCWLKLPHIIIIIIIIITIYLFIYLFILFLFVHFFFLLLLKKNGRIINKYFLEW